MRRRRPLRELEEQALAWAVVAVLLAGLSWLLLGCATHAMEYAMLDEHGATIGRVRSVDWTLLRVSDTALAIGKAKITSPIKPPLQHPDEDDEAVAAQFEALVAELEREGRVRDGLPPDPPPVYTTLVGNELAYLVSDREASEDLGKLVRTGFMAALYAYLFGYAGEAIGIGLDYLDSP